MVTIRKKIIEKNEYYYLEHTVRLGGKPVKKEKYLGTELPKNIEELKKDFLSEVYKERWYPLLDKIKLNYFSGNFTSSLLSLVDSAGNSYQV